MIGAAETNALEATGEKPKSAATSIDGGGLISRTESGWLLQVGSEQVEFPPDTESRVAAQRFAALFGESKAADRRCVIGLASSECFFADLPLPDALDPKDRGAVTFELERHFPLDAEAMVAEFHYDANRKRVSAIAVESDRQRELIDELESVGIDVVAIIPHAYLIARAVQLWRNERSPFRLLLREDGSTDLLTVEDQGVCQWRQFFDADDDLQRHRSVTNEEDDTPLILVTQGHNEWQPPGEIRICDRTPSQLAAEGANLALRSRWVRWPNFRRDQLAPKDPLFGVAGPLRNLAIAAAICFLALIVSAELRSSKIRQQAENVRQQQRNVFTEAFPDRRVPVMMMRTVRNEHRKTLGSRGRGDKIALPVPATAVMDQLYRGLDHARRVGEAKFRLIDINILDGECSFTVRVVDPAKVGTIAKSLESFGFDVAPPASEQIDPSKDEPIPTYQSTIKAVRTAKAAAETGSSG